MENAIEIDVSALSGNLREVSAEMERTVTQEMLPLAQLLEETFAATARSIEEELTRAARTGSFRFKEMAQGILSDLASLAADKYIRQPLEQVIGGLLGGGLSGGVLGGVPGVGISPIGKSSAMTINLNLGQTMDVRGFQQSETQIAASMSRLLSRAGRNG